MVHPNDPGHAALLADVQCYLDELGFMLESCAYHDVMSKAAVDRLKTIDNLNSQIVRTRSDRIAIHRTLPLVFWIEAKTSAGQNFGIEAVPLATHICHAKPPASALTLYVCRHLRDDGRIDRGFWCDQLPPLKVLFVPPRGLGYEGYIRNYIDVPNSDVVRSLRTNGSDDPFVLIERTEFTNLRPWPELIRELVDNIEAINGTYPH